MKLPVRDGWIEADGFRFKGEYPVLHATLVNDRVVVIYDWMAFDRGVPARNLFCYDRSGSEIWRAQDIDWGAVDAYTNVTQENPLWVSNFAGFNCRIDEATGHVLAMDFTK
jgi:hypothetical protein